VRHPKRGRTRAVDLTAEGVEALRAWTQSRPEAASDHVFVSLARNRPPEPLVPRALNKLVAVYAERAGLPEDRRTPHVLRHTFCTRLADGGQGLDVVEAVVSAGDDAVAGKRSSPSWPDTPTCGPRRAMCRCRRSEGRGRCGRRLGSARGRSDCSERIGSRP